MASKQTPDPDLDRLLERLRARGRAVATAIPMAGDVSHRRYLRLVLAEGRTVVLALYPPELEPACERSLVSGRLLHEHGIRVATVLDTSCRETGLATIGGWALLEDLGERTLYDLAEHPWRELEPYFEDAVAQLPRLAALPERLVADLNPPLDRELLSRELEHTRTSWLEPRGVTLDDETVEALEALCARVAEVPPVPCHRDYGARNLMPLPREGQGGTTAKQARVAVIDHQDLRLGPPLYDLASLLNDSLFPPPEAERALLEAAGIRTEEERVRYHRTAAQRTLKAIGSYAAFALRGDLRHEGLIAPTFERAVGHLARLPEAGDLAPRMARICRPALEPPAAR